LSSKAIKTLAIANRGEVAVRIIRACQEMGIRSVLLHSEADVGTIAFRISDEQICIGAAESSQSYLNIQNNINGALAAGADAIHPGFGFLSENSDFAQACIDAGLIFIGPSPNSIKLFGDKISAKKLVEELGVKTIPGHKGEKQHVDSLIAAAKDIGFPVLVKAAAGGGGRGLKVLQSEDGARPTIESAQRESLAAFGSDMIFLEKYLVHAKHIEVQVFGDASGKVHTLLERECTIQRRHQKIVEEATSPSITQEQRGEICLAAKRIAEKAKYKGAGTVEFLLENGEFYFIEMNTRVQVEHPVTEMVLGVDLIKAQILTAQSEALAWPSSFTPRGHAIECRIYAEDPFLGGIPSIGVLGDMDYPQGPGRRFEVGFESGDELTPFYDSMFSKIVVWDETRPRAIKKMLRVLNDTIIFGVKTNIPFLKAILSHPDFVSGDMTTRFIEINFPRGLEGPEISKDQLKFAELCHSKVRENIDAASPESIDAPWLTNWRPL